jgi:hypothetical protein
MFSEIVDFGGNSTSVNFIKLFFFVTDREVKLGKTFVYGKAFKPRRLFSNKAGKLKLRVGSWP